MDGVGRDPQATDLDDRGVEPGSIDDERRVDRGGIEPGSSDQRGSDQRGSDERGSDERGSPERGGIEPASHGRGSDERGVEPGSIDDERGSIHRGSNQPGSNDCGSNQTGRNERGSVELMGVTKRFGAVVAVDHLDLVVRPGEFLSLLGPSGCGKTTTLRMLAGFEQPDEGHIRISGDVVDHVPPYKRDVNTVFQHYSLFPHMTVAENVAYGLRQKRVPRKEIATRVGDALDMVRMTGFGSRRPRQLSGGQQQRVALARALVNRPSVLLLDEPLGALDRKLREEMQIELKLLQRELGTTFVFVTHDQEEAMGMSDRIAVMLDGHIEQLADPETVYERPTSAFVAAFIGRNNFWTGVSIGEGVRADDGTIFVVSDPEEPVPPGEPALAALRPESIALAAERPDHSTNVMRGTVAGVSHYGDVLQYVVRTATRDVISILPRTGAPRLAPGDEVWCHWVAEDVYMFSAAQADLVLNDPATNPAVA